jgi:hypothetical protein
LSFDQHKVDVIGIQGSNGKHIVFVVRLGIKTAICTAFSWYRPDACAGITNRITITFHTGVIMRAMSIMAFFLGSGNSGYCGKHH